VIEFLHNLWSMLRTMSGDDSYERYVAHWRACHGGKGAPLDRRAFFIEQQRRKWDGVSRCC
jgi:uncharacterized short protein YbdD (DUF466 family)